MSDEIVREIIETRLQDNWLLTDIDFDNIRFKPKRGSSFISVIISEDDSKVKGLNCIERIYTVIIEIRVPKNIGTVLISSYATQLKSLFESYTEGNFYCIKGNTLRIGNTNEWHQRNVILSCKYKEII